VDAQGHKAIYRRYIELLWTPDRLDEVLASDFIAHDLPAAMPPGREGLKAFRRIVNKAFPDLKAEIVDIVAEGDRVAARIAMTGTHRAEFLGVAATNNQVRTQLFEFVRFADGKIVDRWVMRDRLDELQQLGAFPRRP